MKKLALVLFFSAFGIVANAQSTSNEPKSNVITNQVIEIACGECKFKMQGKGCDLAIRIDGKSYFVDGKTVDDFGDAHAEHGFCNSISKAEVSGEIINNRFKAKTIKLLPVAKKG